MKCPFHIGAATPVNFGLTATVPAGTLVANQIVMTLWDWNLNDWSTGVNIQTTWNVDDNPWTIVVTGTYPAGNAGFDASGNGFDTMLAQFYTTPGPYPQAIATLVLSYSRGFPSVDVVAPDSVGAGVSFTAHASISDVNYAAPVTHQWTVNGSPVAGDGPDITLHGPVDGSEDIGVVSIDALGVQHASARTVYACSGFQITC